MRSGESILIHQSPLISKRSLMILLLCLFSFAGMTNVVGRPPITEIQIPSEPYITYFDLAQDDDNVIYLSYDNGLKIFDGHHWQTLLIPDTYLTRELYFDQKDRVYVGGFNFFGYVTRNQLGQYEFIDLTPKENPISFASIWEIIECQNQIFFRALNHVFVLQAETGQIKTWSFENRLGDIVCYNNTVLLQDRTAGMKVLEGDQWVSSSIELQDNSLIYAFEILDNQQVFIRSASDNWRIIEDQQIKAIEFSEDLPELGSYATSLTLDNNKILMGSSDGLLTFFDFNTYQTESFPITSDWISAMTLANDGGILILSNFKIFHLSWPSPWRIQDHTTGLSSDIFDLAYWNKQLYATARSGVFAEQSNPVNNHTRVFQQQGWTHKEAWSLLPLSDDEILLADSHHIISINKAGVKSNVSDVIYPRFFQKSKYHPNHIFVYTELDARILLRDTGSWIDWVLIDNKTNGIVELSADTLLITTYDGTLKKVTYDLSQKEITAELDLTPYAIEKTQSDELFVFDGPENQVFIASSDRYFQWQDDELIESDLLGLAKLLPAKSLSNITLEEDGSFWAISATQAFIRDSSNQWRVIDATPYLQGGLHDLVTTGDQIKLSANSVILTYLTDEPVRLNQSTGKLMITSATYNINKGNDLIQYPVNNKEPFVIGPGVGNLTFQYAFTDILKSKQTTYQYRLKGHNNLWSPLSQNTEASFLGLPAGTYQFEVKAVDANGQTHTSEALSFIKQPVWYLSSWAKAIWGFGFLMLLYLTLRSYLKWREKKHELQKQSLKAIINEKTQALKLANEALQELAHKDSLTGLSNRLYLDKYIHQLTQNNTADVVVLMIDIDHFKKYNDTYGHLAGDQLLEKFALLLLTRFKRKADLIARYGGEEFLILMPETSLQYALKMAESIRQYVEQQFEETTISIGVALTGETLKANSPEDVFSLIDQADQALYQAKTAGRNQVILFDHTKVNS